MEYLNISLHHILYTKTIYAILERFQLLKPEISSETVDSSGFYVKKASSQVGGYMVWYKKSTHKMLRVQKGFERAVNFAPRCTSSRVLHQNRRA